MLSNLQPSHPGQGRGAAHCEGGAVVRGRGWGKAGVAQVAGAHVARVGEGVGAALAFGGGRGGGGARAWLEQNAAARGASRESEWGCEALIVISNLTLT